MTSLAILVGSIHEDDTQTASSRYREGRTGLPGESLCVAVPLHAGALTSSPRDAHRRHRLLVLPRMHACALIPYPYLAGPVAPGLSLRFAATHTAIATIVCFQMLLNLRS